ncbi:uncharacterized protein LOC115622968 [Scaptodrosophila lebanonensis]|uniref:Uncharacterized protein LOC115622968 n=1 Tax=Drosophila lebanonensis TaxID=7225 RepID=A0A6J2TDB3_DROLE|nr:uncharacterized protein LOC115622968 [Scaptodrosophila lebanonensis]
MYSRILFCLLLHGTAVSLVRGDCNTCTYPSEVACVSATQFQFCVNNSPTGPVNTCPNGMVCTGGATICQGNGVAPAACSGCNECNLNQTFACTGPRTFALCLGSSVISNITGNCAPYHVCNIDTPNICGNATLGSPATCSFIDSTPTPEPTTTPTTDPTAYCRLIRQNGRFPYGTLLCSTCRQYIGCYLLSGIWYGAIYTCPGNLFFDSTSRYCTKTVPARCSLGVQNIQLFNITLE